MSLAKEIVKPYMTWGIESISKAKNYFKELKEAFPETDVKTYFSSLDESIIVEKDIDGNEQKSVYILKSNQNGKKFEYKHALQDEDDIHKIREKAWENFEAWKFQIEEQKLKKEENVKEITQS